MSRKLITISGIFGVSCGYLYFAEHIEWALIPTISLAFVLILSWVFQYQIDIWWTRRSAPKVDAHIRQLLSANSQFYALLSEADKEVFDWRMSVFTVSKDYIAQGFKSVPDDAKFICAFYATWLTWKRGDHLMSPFDRFVFYLHPFMTPNYPEQVHIYEVEQVDGTTILAIEHFMMGFRDPRNYYSTGLHCAIETFLALNGQPTMPIPPDVWDRLERVSTINRKKIETYTGMAQEDPWPVIIYHALIYPKEMENSDKELYEEVKNYLFTTEI